MTLRKASPFWWWVRGNPSLVLALVGMGATGLWGWHDVKSRLGTIEKKVDEIAAKKPEVTPADLDDLRNLVAQMQGRWQQVDSVPTLARSHRAQRTK